MRASVVLVVLLAGCSTVEPTQEIVSVPSLEGTVLDALFRPLPDATVTWNGTSVDVGPNGSYEIIGPRPGDIVVAAAPGFVSDAVTVAQARHDFVLAPLPRSGYSDTQSFDGLIACGFIVQAGHSHGSGDPDEDNHMSCDAVEDNKNTFVYVPESNPQDLLVQLFWTPGSDWATHMTLVLRDDAGEVIVFEEGTSPLRMEVAAVLAQEHFADGREGMIQVLPGIPSGNIADIYVGAHVDQRFEVHATSFHGMDMPAHWTV